MAGYLRADIHHEEGNAKHKTGIIIYSHIFKRENLGPVFWISFD